MVEHRAPRSRPRPRSPPDPRPRCRRVATSSSAAATARGSVDRPPGQRPSRSRGEQRPCARTARGRRRSPCPARTRATGSTPPPPGSAPSCPGGTRDGRSARSAPFSTPTRTASPTREASESAHSSDRPRSSWLSRNALPSCSIAGPSRYLPVSGSCSTSSCDSRVRSSPYAVPFARPSRSASLGDARGATSPRTERLQDARRALDRLDRAARAVPARSRVPASHGTFASAANSSAVDVAPGILMADAARSQVRGPSLARLHRHRRRASLPCAASAAWCAAAASVAAGAQLPFERRRAPARTRRRSSCRPPRRRRAPGSPSRPARSACSRSSASKRRAVAERLGRRSRKHVPNSGPAAPPTR